MQYYFFYAIYFSFFIFIKAIALISENIYFASLSFDINNQVSHNTELKHNSVFTKFLLDKS